MPLLSIDDFAFDHIDFMMSGEQADVAAGGGADDLQIPIIRSDEDLDAFLLGAFGVVLPRACVCQKRGHRSPHEAFHNAYFARDPVAIWKASRGFGGKSFTLALLGVVEAVTLRADVNVLGGSGQQSARVLEAQKKLWDHPGSPRGALQSEPGAIKTTFRWGNVINALMASQKSVRGPHPQRLRMDEIDEMDKAILRSALGQPMSKGPVLSQVVLSSTHQYPDGTMTWALKEARVNGWAVYEWCLEETREANGGWVSEAEIARKRATMIALDWETEVELQEPKNEDPAIVLEKVIDLFSPNYHLEEAPDPAGAYAHGADWAKRLHFTSIATLRKATYPDPMILVKLQSMQREPWPMMVQKFEDRIRLFGGPAAHDETGLGTVISDLLTVDAEGFQMVGNARKALLSEFIGGIEHDEIRVPDVEQREVVELKSMLKNLTRAMVYGSEHPPDQFVALALAYRAASQTVGGSGQMKLPDNTPNLSNLHTPQQGGNPVFGRRRPGRIWGKS